MSLQTCSLIVCVFLAQMAAGTGVQFVMERHPDNYFCGHLQCLADFTRTDHDVSTFVQMAIYDITRVNSELRLASVSTFDPDLHVDITKSSAMGCTGTISRLEANLTLQLRHDIDCLYGVYKCQLDLVTVSGHSEELTEIVTPEYNHSYSRIAEVLSHFDRLTELLNSFTILMNSQAAQINRLANQSDTQTDQFVNQTAQLNRLTSQLDDQAAQIHRLANQSDDKTAQLVDQTAQLVDQTAQLVDQTAHLHNISQRCDLDQADQKQRDATADNRLNLPKDKLDKVLDIRMQPTPGDTYCGYLQCTANSSRPVIAMTIYNITENDNPVKLVSISIFAPEISIEQSQIHVINASGKISTYKGNLGISFVKAANCLHESFQCELNFVDVNGLPDVLRANLTGVTEQNATVLYMLTEITSQLKEHSEQTDKELKALQQDNEVVKTMLSSVIADNEVVKTMLGSVISELSRVEELLNSTLSKDQPLGSSCYRGMPHKNAREKFLLSGKVLALCDTETDGGGWVVIQRRVRGDVDFYRGWDEYKKGFGTPDTDLWIGNDIIHNLTSQGYNELRIDFVYKGTNYFAQYTNFGVADESSKYRITISGFSGNVYDSMRNHNGNSFSTSDRDNDLDSGSCSVMYHGSWWYNGCYNANLNGAWAKADKTGIAWNFSSSDFRWPLTFTEMKVRYLEKAIS